MPRATRRTKSSQGHQDNLADVENNAQSPSSTTPPPSSPPSSKHDEAEEKEEVHEDDLCPICHLLLYRPVTTSCRHTLCETCMAHWADVSVATNMTIMPLGPLGSTSSSGDDGHGDLRNLHDAPPAPGYFFEEPEGGELGASGAGNGDDDDDHPNQVEARCPMCRTLTRARYDARRAGALRTRYPRTYAERREEEEGEGWAERGEGGTVEMVTLYVGNRHRLRRPDEGSRNCHEWTFFVRPSNTEIVEEVQMLLHPTFRPPRVIRSAPPYQITRLGWGFFTITAYVILKAGYSWVSEDAEAAPDGAEKGMLPLEWTLDFNEHGSQGRIRLKVRNEVWVDESSSEEDDEDYEEDEDGDVEVTEGGGGSRDTRTSRRVIGEGDVVMFGYAVGS